MDRKLLDKQDSDMILENLVFNYCLNNEEPLFIKSFIHHNHIDFSFSPDCFYFFITGTHKKYRSGSTPNTVKINISNVQKYYDAANRIMRENGYIGRSFLIKVDNSKQVGIIFSPTAQIKKLPLELAEQFHHLYHQKFSYSRNSEKSSTSLTGPYSGYENIHQAFLDARVLNDLLFFGVRNTVITEDFKKRTAKTCSISAIHANVRKLISIICYGTCTQALNQVNTLIRDMVAPSYSMDSYVALFSHCQDMLNMLETVYSQHVSFTAHSYADFFSLEEYHAYLRNTIIQVFDQLNGTKRYSPTILMTLSYINQNYTHELSLLQLSEYMYINTSTLSSVFNDEVGMSLSEYIAKLRVEKAQEMLRTTSLSVADIAQCVSFSSPDYFRKIFKKQTGMSPQLYKQQYEKDTI